MGNGPQMMAFTNEKKTKDLSLELKQRKEKIKGQLYLFPGSQAILNITCRDVTVSVSLGEVQYAKSQPVTPERVRQQLEKLGNTPFIWESLDIEMDDSIFVPMKVLNELRHQALEELEKVGE